LPYADIKRTVLEELQLQSHRESRKRGTNKSSMKQIDPSSQFAQTKQALRSALQGIESSERFIMANILIITIFRRFRGYASSKSLKTSAS
jgi:hypothetical protein